MLLDVHRLMAVPWTADVLVIIALGLAYGGLFAEWAHGVQELNRARMKELLDRLDHWR